MKKIELHVIICAIFTFILAIPGQGLGAGFSLIEEREQELVSPETIRELARIHYARARNHYRRGEFSKAKAQFQEVLKLEPEHQGARWYLKCVEEELAKFEKTYPGRRKKIKEQKKTQDLKATLDSIEQRSAEGKLRAEIARRKQLEKEEAELSKQLEKYRTESNQAKERKKLTAHKAAQLQKEKKQLEARLKKYKQALKKQKRLIEKIHRKPPEQEESARLKEAEAEKQKLASQLKKLRREEDFRLKAELKKYKQSLRDKFDQKIDELNKNIESYETKVKQYETKVKQLEQTAQQLERAQSEKQRLRAELVELRKEQQARLKDELQKHEEALQDKLAQKEVRLDEKITLYETRLAQLEEEGKKLEKTSADTYKQALELSQAEQEKQRLVAGLTELRKEQRTQLKEKLEKYERTFQDKLTQKEAELDEKIKLFETKIKDLQRPQPPAETIPARHEYIQAGGLTQDRLKEELVQVGPAPETGLIELQMKINEQLHAQLDEFKKEKAQAFYEQGSAHFKNKKYTLARESFQKALSIYPDYAAVKKALKDLETQEKVNLHLDEGEYYFREKEYEKACEEFSQVLALDYKNRQARNYLHKIEKEKSRLAKEQRQAKQQAVIQARKKAEKEQERKARQEKLAKLKAEKEERLTRLKAEKEVTKQAKIKAREEKLTHLCEAEDKRCEEARLRKEQERRAREERLAKLKAEKEAKERVRQEKLAKLKAEKEEKLRLKREAEERRREEICLKRERERQAHEERLARIEAEKEERLAKLKAEKEEHLRLKREAEAKRREEERKAREQARLKKEQERKAQEEKLAKLKAEKEQRLAKLKAEKEEHLRLKREAEAKRREEERKAREQARLRKEQECKAQEEKLAKLKAEKEERLAKLKADEEKRFEQKRLTRERNFEQKRLTRERKAKEKALKRAQAELTKQAKIKAREEKLAHLKAEKEEHLRLKLEAEEKRCEEERKAREQARLKKEQERKAQEEKLAKLKAEKEKKQKELQKKIELHYSQGKKHFQNKDYIAARKEFKDILILDPKNQYTLNALEKVNATEAREEREYKRRKREREEAQRKERQSSINQHLAQGKIYLHQQQYQKAIEEFGKVLFLDPNNSLAEKYMFHCKKERAFAKHRQEARLKKEQERKAQEEKLAKLKAEKEAKECAHQERLARLKAEKEEKLRLKCEAKEKRQEEARLRRERRAKEIALKRAQAELTKQARIKARKEELVRLKAEKEERLRLKLEAEEKRHEEARLKKAQERKAREERPAKLKAEKEAKERTPQERLARLAAEKEERLRLKREAEEKRREEVRLKKEQKRKAREERLARIKAEKEEKLRLKREVEQRRLEQARLRKEQKRKAREERLARLAAEKEERLRLKLEGEAKRQEEARLRREQECKAREERLAKLKAEKEAKERPRQERLARLAAEKEERLRLKLEAEAKRQEEARLRREQERKAREERLARLAAEKEERLRLKREAEEKRREEARLKKAQERKAREEKLAKLKAEEEAREHARQEKLAKLKAEKEEKLKKQARQRQRGKELRLHLAQGKIHYYCEQYEQAIEEFKQVLFIDPEYSSAGEYIHKCQKGIEEQKRKELLAREKEAARLKKTAELIREEKEKEKLEKIKELYGRGKNYFRRGQYLEAVACFEKVIELEGNPRIYYTPQAKEYIEQAGEKIEEEKKEDAQQIAEEEVERRKGKGVQKLKAKERAEEEVRRREEETIREHYNLGKKYYRQGNYPMAIAEFNKIEEINPQHSLISYAEKYIQKCRKKIIRREEIELKEEMKREAGALKEEAISAKSLLEQARWYYRRGDYEQMAKVCRAALQLDPLNKKARNLLHTAELKQVKREKKQADKEVWIDEKEMMAEVAKAQVLPEEKILPVKERKIIPIVKVPAIREKLKNPITVDFRDVDLSYVLNFLADSTGVNIIPASGVSLEAKKVSIRMKDIPAENALKYILKNQGLTYRIEQDAIWVASPAELDKEEVESRVYFLNRGSGMFTEFERTVGTGTGLGGAASISKVTTIKDILEQAVDWPKNSKLVLDERSGALVVSNIPSNLQIIEDLLYNLDVTPMQVLIEARFVELKVEDTEELGIEWQLTAALGDKRRDGSNVTQWESGSGWDFSDFPGDTRDYGLNLTYAGVLTYPEFQAVLHALSKTQSAKTLSAPRITTLNNQMATIKVVDEWIYPTRYEFQAVEQFDVDGNLISTRYRNVPVDFITKDVGILLHVTPNIGADGKTITLALVPEVSSGEKGYFEYTGDVSLPLFSSRTLSTSVVINNGDTVVLGGLINESTIKKVTKVPLLGDIPILGYLFRKQTDSVERRNLLIFVTASIISPSGEKIETLQQP